MKQFDKDRNSSALGSARTWVTTLAVLAVASAGFAAVGGVEQIKKLIRISINGEVQEFATDENGEGSFVVDTGNGGTATVNVRSVDSLDEVHELPHGVGKFEWREGEEGEHTVDIDVTSDGEHHVKVMRSVGPDGQVRIHKFVSKGGDISDREDGATGSATFNFVREDGEDGNVFIRKIRIGEDGETIDDETLGDLEWISEDDDALGGHMVKVIKLRGGDGEERQLKFVGMGDDFEGVDIQDMLERKGVTRVEMGEDGVPTIHLDGLEEGANQVIDIITTGLECDEGKQMTMVKVQVEAEVGNGEPKN